MATDLDLLPIYDPILRGRPDLINDVWGDALSRNMDTLISYFGQFGFMLPNLTTSQRDEIQFPQNGQLMYNTTIDSPQFYQESSGTWRTLTFT